MRLLLALLILTGCSADRVRCERQARDRYPYGAASFVGSVLAGPFVGMALDQNADARDGEVRRCLVSVR